MLRGYMDDLTKSAPADRSSIATRFSSFNTKLRLVVNCIEKDDVLRYVAAALHGNGHDAVRWFKELAEGKNTRLDATPGVELSNRYLALYEIKRGRIDLRSFVSARYADESGFPAAFIRFRDDYISAFETDMGAFLGRIEGRLAGQDGPFDEAVWATLQVMDAPPAPKKKATKKKATKKTTTKKAVKKTTKKKAAKKSAKKTAAKKTAKKKAAKKTAAKKTAKKKKAAKKTTRKK
jgi:hypothetical protein